MLGDKLKFPRGREILTQPINLDYKALSDMIFSDHKDDTLYFLALTELKTRYLARDFNEGIASKTFFLNNQRDADPKTLNVVSYLEVARTQINRSRL